MPYLGPVPVCGEKKRKEFAAYLWEARKKNNMVSKWAILQQWKVERHGRAVKLWETRMLERWWRLPCTETRKNYDTSR